MQRFILTIIIILAAICLSATTRMVARIDAPSPETVARFLSQGADIASYKPGVYLDLVVTEAEYQSLLAQYPGLRVTQTEQQIKQNLHSAKDIPGYRNYAQLTAELMQLQAQYPYLVEVSSLGSGWGSIYASQGFSYYQNFDHQLWAVKVSANVSANEDKPAFYFVGEHHAREPLSTEACMGILIHSVENYGLDPTVTNILDTSEIWIVPLLNPDGHKIVLQETDIWWRKNIRDNNDNHSFNHGSYGSGLDGVDLNRNYGWHWGYTSATDDQNSVTYHGAGPFSEPETQALRDFLLSRHFLAGIGYHTYGEYMLYPFGYLNGILAPDQTELAALASEVTALLPSQNSGFYAPGPSWGLYPVSGGLDDWIYGETGTFAYTIEMATEFIPPASQIPQIVQHQVNGAMALIQRKDRRILKGHVTDAETGNPLSALVLVDGIDGAPVFRKPISSEPEYGSYYYFLPVGQHTVHFICPGWETQSMAVQINDSGPTVYDIALLPVAAQELNIQVQDDTLQPLSGVTVSFDDLPLHSFVSAPDGWITVPDFYPGLYRLTASKPDYETLRVRRDINCGTITLRLTGQPVFSDGFELNVSNWVSTGTWNRISSEYFSGSYSLTDSPNGNYQNNSNTICRLASPIPLQGLQNADIQFQLKRSLALDGDILIVEASTNGSTWIALGFYEGSSDWEAQSYSLNSFLGNNLHFRFRLNTSESTTSAGVFIDDVKIFVNAAVSENSDSLLPPATLSLSAGPNPFSGSCKIKLNTPTGIERGDIRIYDIRGRMVRQFSLEGLGKGIHSFTFDGCDNQGKPLASGVYLMQTDNHSGPAATSKLMLIK